MQTPAAAAFEYNMTPRKAESRDNQVGVTQDANARRTSLIQLEGSIMKTIDVIRRSEHDGTPQERDQAYWLLTAVEQIIEERAN